MERKKPEAAAEKVAAAEALAAIGLTRASFDLTLPKLTPNLMDSAGIAGANRAALSVAHACGGSFIRAEGFHLAAVADEGLLDEADAGACEVELLLAVDAGQLGRLAAEHDAAGAAARLGHPLDHLGHVRQLLDQRAQCAQLLRGVTLAMFAGVGASTAMTPSRPSRPPLPRNVPRCCR